MLNKEISILVQNAKAFEHTEEKNRFIRNAKTEWIGFVDGDVTSREDLCQILEENPFLMDYDVVLFGEDIPEGECGLFELLEHPQATIYALCFSKELLVQTGSFNSMLPGNVNYEFLLRLAKAGRVFAIPCSAEKNTFFEPITMAYVVRRYMEELKESGRLDEIFLGMMQAAEALGMREKFGEAMNLFLSDTAEYERIAADTAPFLILISGEKCYGVVAGFGDLLADALVDLGQAVITTNDRYGDYENIPTELLLNQVYKAIIGFQAPALESDTFLKMKGKRYQFWFDNPVFSIEYFTESSKDTYVLCHDADYVRFMQEHYHVGNAMQFPLAGTVGDIQREELYDLVFIGSYMSCSEEKYEDAFKQKFYEYMMSHSESTVEQGIRMIWQEQGVAYEEERFLKTIVELWDVCYDLLQNYRHRVVETILSAGIQMHVFGDSWKEYKGPGCENLILHPEVHGEEALEIWAKAKIGLNIMNGHKAGITERIANIMLCGACCLSDETSYLKEHFRDGEEFVLFHGDKLEKLPEKIRYLLQHVEERRRIAFAGQEKARREYTWRKRAEELLGIIEMSEKTLDENKIAFIICTNDEQELEECLFYLNRLNVPDGFEIELFAVESACSMTSGYNEAMNASDAKYKIYLHQDVFIINPDFLTDMIAVFQDNPDIGLMGCIGGGKLPEDANAITAWDTGRLLHNCVPNETIGYQDENQNPVEVEAVDGCLIATQYDIPWREDLFDGWDFYDISQCFEFRRSRKKVAIPYQEANWIYHDNGHAKMTDYDHYRKLFAEEYREYNFKFGEKKVITGEYYALREKVVSLVKDLFYRGEMESVCAVFADPANRGNLALKEYELLAKIYREEDLQDEKSLFFVQDMPKIMDKLRYLKHLLKRIEFNAGCREENIRLIVQGFSVCAIKETILAYCVEKEETWEKIRS